MTLRDRLAAAAPASLRLPGDAGYDLARAAWNLAADQRPAAVVAVDDVRQVRQLVGIARESGLRVAPQRTGHNAVPLVARRLDDVILVRTHPLREVTLRGDVVRVGGGAVWGEVVAEVVPHGRTVLHGSHPEIGVAGYTVGGGLGWYGRAHGLASGSVVAVELVTGDGALVRADAEHDPELFWAVRGGGGGFGVITALELRTFPLESAYAGAMAWDLERGESVLRTWAQWAPSAPDEVTTAVRVLRYPQLASLPASLRGRRLMILDGAVIGDDELAARVLAPFRALRPEIDTFARTPAARMGAVRAHSDAPVALASHSASIPALSDGAIDAFLEAAGPDADTSLAAAELRQLGGALGRPHPAGGVLDRLDGAAMAYALCVAPDARRLRDADADAVRAFADALSPYASARPFLNFVETPIDPALAFPAGDYARLGAIRRSVDPTGVFAASHPIALADG